MSLDSSSPVAIGQQKSPWRLALAAGVLGALALIGAGIYVLVIDPALTAREERATQKTEQTPPPSGLSPMMNSTPFIMPGLRTPPTRPADEVDVKDDAPVIGVSAGGKHRAYLTRIMFAIHQHVINDLLGDEPVTVTYCNRTDCAAAFHGDQKGVPLNLRVGGWHEGKMLIFYGQGFYFQNTGKPMNPGVFPELPYASFPCELTTWKAWKTAHPDTDIFVGDLPPDMQPPFGAPAAAQE